MSGSKSTLDKYGPIISWVGGIFLALMGISILGDAGGIMGTIRAVVAAVLLIVTAAIVIPPIRRRIASQSGLEFGRVAVVVIAVMGLVIGVSVAPSVDSPEDSGIATDAGATTTETASGTTTEPTQQTATETTTTGGPTEEAELLFKETIENGNTITGISPTGDTIAVGTRNGDLILYEPTGESTEIPLSPTSNIQYLYVPNDNQILASWSNDAFGSLNAEGEEQWSFTFEDLWWMSASANGEHIAVVNTPIQGPGSLALISSGSAQGETELQDASGIHVDVSESGNHVVVGTEKYYDSEGELQGESGIEVYSNELNLQWEYATEYPVTTVDISEKEEIIVAGTDDNKHLAYDLEGELLWEYGDEGFMTEISKDGSTVVSSQTNGIVARDRSGTEQWQLNTEITPRWPNENHVNNDGSRVLITDSYNSEVILIEEGEIIWHEEYPEGSLVGTMSSDGTTWSIVVDPNEDDVFIEAFRLNK